VRRANSRWARRLALLLAILSVEACGTSTPTAPTRVPLTAPPASGLPYLEAPYRLGIMGFDGVGAPGGGIIPGCVGIGPSGLGFSVSTTVVLRRDGESWRGTPATAHGGEFELVIGAGSGEANPGSLPVTGTARGVVQATFQPAFGRADARVTFGATAGETVGLTATVARPGFVTDGTITGAAVFSAPDGPVINCTPGTVRWSLTGPAF
jgi:hypothetical protein